MRRGNQQGIVKAVILTAFLLVSRMTRKKCFAYLLMPGGKEWFFGKCI
jgi:hypothetical protein